MNFVCPFVTLFAEKGAAARGSPARKRKGVPLCVALEASTPKLSGILKQCISFQGHVVSM
jgi:hypothetical protein